MDATWTHKKLELQFSEWTTAMHVDTPAGACVIAPQIAADRLRRGVLSISQLIAASTLTDETIRWPSTWWEAVKERWFPAWAQRRWPVVYAVRHLRARDLYPGVERPPGMPFVTVAWMEHGVEHVGQA